MDDMANYPHLSRHSKSGNLCFRRGVPAALREIVGKREITKSFGTNVLKDALPDYHRIASQRRQSVFLKSLIRFSCQTALAIDFLVKMLSPACQIGCDKAGIGALRRRLDTRDHLLFAALCFCLIVNV
ncbi:MAG: DUF6538 domain-containing protein [Pseudomonadota bacterium]